MLKEDPRYDYEESAEIAPQSWRALRTRRIRSIRMSSALPVGSRMSQLVSSVPQQTYLRERFPHIGGKNHAAKALQAENQRRFAVAMARGNSRLSRTSGDWHPITPAEISAALEAIEKQRLREIIAA